MHSCAINFTPGTAVEVSSAYPLLDVTAAVYSAMVSAVPKSGS